MTRPFVIVTGLPGSGKSTLAHRLAPLLQLPVLDKDDILERLFHSKGIGDRTWRRGLSRESDWILQMEACASEGALLVSFWHAPGMASDSGTPYAWLAGVSHCVVNVHCVCPAEIAAQRFRQRQRHPGHLDSDSSAEQVLANIQAISKLAPLELGRRIECDTSRDDVPLDELAGEILEAIRSMGGAGR